MEVFGSSERTAAPSMELYSLPVAFLEFLSTNGLDPSIYGKIDNIPRYIRLKQDSEPLLVKVASDLSCKLDKVNWLPGFFAIPPQIQIASSKVYSQGKIHGIDAASGAAVSALDVSPGDHVLDLCAAPGAKLCMLSDILGDSGSLTGVDIAKSRLAACRTMLRKYALGDRCRLFVADGTSFSLLPSVLDGQSTHDGELENSGEKCNSYLASDISSHSEGSGRPAAEEAADVYQEWSPRMPWKERRKIKQSNKDQTKSMPNAPLCELLYYGKHSGIVGLRKDQLFQDGNRAPNGSGYDKVLVDAECTHDGSVRHIHKFERWGWDTLQHRLLDAQRIDSLTQLQLQLLTNGFRLLKVGGSLVYSTCSLTVAHNEDIVEQFLLENPSAELQEIAAAKHWPCRSGRIPRTIRFDPLTSQTSGLFIAKILKLF